MKRNKDYVACGSIKETELPLQNKKVTIKECMKLFKKLKKAALQRVCQKSQTNIGNLYN